MELKIPDAELRKLVREVVRQVLSELDQHHGDLDGVFAGRACIGEGEAAAVLGIRQHQLRDMRARGEIRWSQGPKRKPLFTREQLLDYLSRREVER